MLTTTNIVIYATGAVQKIDLQMVNILQSPPHSFTPAAAKVESVAPSTTALIVDFAVTLTG